MMLGLKIAIVLALSAGLGWLLFRGILRVLNWAAGDSEDYDP